MNLADFILHLSIAAILQEADIYHHIHLSGTICHSILCLKNLCGSGAIAVREADNGADWQLALYILSGLLYIGCRNTG